MGLFDRKKKGGEDTQPQSEAVESSSQDNVVDEADATNGAARTISSADLRAVRIEPGEDGWGDGVTVTPTEDRAIVLSVAAGGIHPVATQLAELSGAEVLEGFGHEPVMDMVAAVVIETDSSARISAYAINGTPTVNVAPAAPSGPLAEYISADNYVSGVGADQIVLVESA